MKIFKSIRNFSGADPLPGVPLEMISPLSKRAYVLMMRSRDKALLHEGFLNIAGAIEMLAGLEYHHDNVLRLSQRLADGEALDEAFLYHEAVAYVNRLGQFYYFAKSELVSKAVNDGLAIIPTIRRFLPFRMKHAVHRSLDDPRDETEDIRILQAMSLSRAWGRMMTLKPGAAPPHLPSEAVLDEAGMAQFRQMQWRNSYVTFQLFDEGASSYLNLILEKEHPTISAEAYQLLSAVILWEPPVMGSGDQ